MENQKNFVVLSQIDVVSIILSKLDDSVDLIRATAVSHAWRHFVIANGLCKKLCLRKVPPMVHVRCVIEENDGILKLFDGYTKNWETLEKEHKVYANLLQVLATPMLAPKECINFPVGASSTDRDPAENVIHTLSPIDKYPWGASYWSSRGQSDTDAPEHIIYRLISSVCIVTEINIRPFEVFWEPGSPIYSAKSVRFRMGHLKSPRDMDLHVRVHPTELSSLDEYVWTYTSPEFPMMQESRLQQFKLPEPAICLGGFVQIELLGRTQQEEIDGLFYICLGHVKILGRSLAPAYTLEMFQPGELLLKYCPFAIEAVLRSFSGEEDASSCRTAVDAVDRLRHVRDLLPLELCEEMLGFDEAHTRLI